MRILIATDQWFPDTKGGVARVAADTAQKLAERGHEVEVIAPRAHDHSAVARAGNLTIHRILRRGRWPKTLSDVAYTWNWVRKWDASAFDVVVAHVSTVAVGIVAARSRAPFVFVFHASPLRELRDLRGRLPGRLHRLSTYPLEPALFLWERVALRRADEVLVLSEFSRSLLAADHSTSLSRTRLVGGAVDTEWFSPDVASSDARERLGVRPSGPLLLTVRRLEPRMGLEQLVRAMSLLDPSEAAELVIVGGGRLDRDLRLLTADLGLESRVRLVGRVDDGVLRDWYRAADLFVLPTVAYEGFGMVTAEALATGTPVVGTPIGATPELLHPLEPSFVARGCEPSELADAIRNALALAGPALSRRCREYALDRFSWTSSIDTWEDALLEVCSTKRPPRQVSQP